MFEGRSAGRCNILPGVVMERGGVPRVDIRAAGLSVTWFLQPFTRHPIKLKRPRGTVLFGWKRCATVLASCQLLTNVDIRLVGP